MKRYNLLIVLLLLIFNVTTAQKKKNSPAADLSVLKETKTKIENTVPLVIKHLQAIADKEGDNNILNNGKTALGKEYGILESEWFLYRNNMKNCILNNSSKKAKKCMEYHTQYLRNTFINYNNYISNLTRKNGYLGVEGDTKFDFKPADIATKLSEAYSNANDAAGRMKGDQKKEFLGQTMSDDNKLTPYSQLAQ
ncbi:hypothetical protein SAMN05421866_0273 [Chryseobacterium oranimense]|jgi:hypothetical protein|uniref:Lysozyme inhibitor LprI N-terminal domain-containing protein n=1 Tax=Chryseobacterium oranimense TaxID=421058 RepID=A0A1M5JGD6_9FLAO|nr:hypothetical protein [Chryseobacterium oranimense]CEJ69057.1 hypothetical protein BN1195_01353 [Chryseobacterium oranimense G311]SHG39113.1 hypothetical protein SAMN05421866_0273 [Chryseobacterium oranimense]